MKSYVWHAFFSAALDGDLLPAGHNRPSLPRLCGLLLSPIRRPVHWMRVALSLGMRQPDREVGSLSPCGEDVKSACSYSPTPASPLFFAEWCLVWQRDSCSNNMERWRYGRPLWEIFLLGLESLRYTPFQNARTSFDNNERKNFIYNHMFVFLALQPFCRIFQSPIAGFSLLIRGFLITHNDAQQSVGLLWTSDQSVAETSTWQHTTLTTDKHPCLPWDSNKQSQQASGRRPTP